MALSQMGSIAKRIAGLSGASAIGLGAYGAHGKIAASPFKDRWETANRYHLVHSVALLGCVAGAKDTLARRRVTGLLFCAGTVAFSGSLYAVAWAEDAAWGKLAPYGGGALILGWLSLVL